MLNLSRIPTSPRKPQAANRGNHLRGFRLCVTLPIKPWKQAVMSMNTVQLLGCRVPQLASIPKTKRQAARQPTHNGSDKDSNERNSGQRVDGRFHNSEDAPVQIRLTRLSSLAALKRLIPYSKQVQRGLIPRAGRDFALPELLKAGLNRPSAAAEVAHANECRKAVHA